MAELTQTCPECNGSGDVKRLTQQYGPDDYEVDVECPSCKGTGVSPAAPHSEPQERRQGHSALKGRPLDENGGAELSTFDPHPVDGAAHPSNAELDALVERLHKCASAPIGKYREWPEPLMHEAASAIVALRKRAEAAERALQDWYKAANPCATPEALAEALNNSRTSAI